MECIEAKALKPSLRREISKKSTQQVIFEDYLLCSNGTNGVPGEDFSVDCFLDFSNGEFEDGFIGEEDEEEKESLSDSSQDRVDDDNNSNSSSLSPESLLTSELPVPVDELAELELEWVSHFFDDSLSEFSLVFPAGKQRTDDQAKNRSELQPKPALTKTPCFPSPIPSKARTKRPRPASRVWSFGSPPLTESSSSTSASSTPCLIFANTIQHMGLLNSFNGQSAKKPKMKPALQTGAPCVSPFQRRCSHCQVQKTPQWRTGPLGAKTLCNACGVRFKSGRLYPEYRPACSPTFSGDIHSNSHRKVMEIRLKKEMTGPDSGLSQMVSGCNV